MKEMQEIITRGKYAYRRAGSFISKFEATQYKNQTLHSLLITLDDPKQMGVGVRYHVYRRIDS